MQSEERTKAINDLTRLVIKIEHDRYRKGGSLPDVEVLKRAVIEWEKGVFATGGDGSAKYAEAIMTKKKKLEATLPVIGQDILDKEVKRMFSEFKSIFRVINMVCPLPRDTKNKYTEEFLDLCHDYAKTKDAQYFIDMITQLYAKIHPSTAEAAKILQVAESELLGLDTAPFGVMNRMIKLYGASRYSTNARRISRIIGGKHALKY